MFHGENACTRSQMRYFGHVLGSDTRLKRTIRPEGDGTDSEAPRRSGKGQSTLPYQNCVFVMIQSVFDHVNASDIVVCSNTTDPELINYC